MLPWGTCDSKVPKGPFQRPKLRGSDNASFKGVFITRNLALPTILVILPPSRSLGTPEFWVPSQFSQRPLRE